MTKLNEYLGSIVSSITNARVMSDVQSVKVAEQYAKHHLLKHFSVPRMRIEDIELTIPVALDLVNEKLEQDFEPIDNRKFNSLVYREVLAGAGTTKLKADMSTKLRSIIAKRTEELEQNLRMSKDIGYLKSYCADIIRLQDEFLFGDSDIKRKMSREDAVRNPEKSLSSEVKVAEERRVLGDFDVIVEAGRLRELKPEHIMHIKLKIREDGMEWDRYENGEGGVESKLIPE
jgi:hypothetical protein